jgi:hypothetical protein
MPLEDMTGSATWEAMNPDWPLGTDLPDAGDDHIRGIKNCTRNQWPNLTDPVLLTSAELNRGDVPVGSVLVFYQAAAPEGWTRVPNITTTQMLRVVASVDVGGVGGGTDDPVENDKVAAHTHPVDPVTTGAQSVGHTHTGTTNSAGSHTHTSPTGAPFVQYNLSAGTRETDPGNGFVVTGNAVAAAGNHTHTMTTGDQSADHEHTVPEHDTAENASAANWVPRYLDVILCQRVSA